MHSFVVRGPNFYRSRLSHCQDLPPNRNVLEEEIAGIWSFRNFANKFKQSSIYFSKLLKSR